MSRRSGRVPTPPGPSVGSLYGGVIDLKPGMVLEPPVARLSVPKTAATDLLLTSSNYFDVDFVLEQYFKDPEKDPDLQAKGIIEEGSNAYTLRIRVEHLLDFAERKAFIVAMSAFLNRNGNNTNFKSLLKASQNTAEFENGYQCGSPQSSWYQVSFVLDNQRYNDDEGEFKDTATSGGNPIGLEDIITTLMREGFNLSPPGTSNGEQLRFRANKAGNNERYKYAFVAGMPPPDPPSQARSITIRVTRVRPA